MVIYARGAAQGKELATLLLNNKLYSQLQRRTNRVYNRVYDIMDL